MIYVGVEFKVYLLGGHSCEAHSFQAVSKEGYLGQTCFRSGRPESPEIFTYDQTRRAMIILGRFNFVVFIILSFTLF